VQVTKKCASNIGIVQVTKEMCKQHLKCASNKGIVQIMQDVGNVQIIF
jgi:hypothetical protein